MTRAREKEKIQISSPDRFPDEVIAGVLFAEFIALELAEERSRRTSLDARGISVLTTSGTLVTLVFAFGSILINVADMIPNVTVLVTLGVSLIAFVAAAILGLLANRLQGYKVVEPKQLRIWRDRNRWTDKAEKARRVLALANIETLESLRRGNNRKTKFVGLALWVQVAAIISLGLAVGGLLFQTI